MVDGYVIIGTKVDNSGFEEGVDDLDKDSKLKKVVDSITEKFTSIGKSTKGIFKNFGSSIKKIGAAVAKLGAVILKTMAKVLIGAVGFGVAFTVALGVVGAIIAGLLILGNAMKKVGEEHQELKTNLQYIVFAVTTALQPAIDWVANTLVKIIQFLIKILQYAMAIANVIAGRNLFENASVEAFAKKMKEGEKSSKKTAKNAKEIRKQLAGFDEMNILQDTSAAGDAGGGGTQLPTFDATNLGDIQSAVDEIAEKIKKFFGEIDKGLGKVGLETADLFNIPFALGKKLGVFIRENIFDPIDQKLGELGFKTTDMFNIPFALGRKLGEFIRTHFKEIIAGIIEIFNLPFTLGIKVGTFLNTKINEIMGKLGLTKDKVKDIFDLPITLGKKTADYITEKINKIKGDIDWLRDRIKENFKEGFWKGLANTIIDIMNKAIDKINSKFKITISDDTAKVLNAVGIKVDKGSHQLVKIPPIPRLATGGIINLPGKGVAVGGERGAEGVIPLTDSQQMETLGEAIGKYITINATILNKMNGRTLSREMTTIRGDNSFANNW